MKLLSFVDVHGNLSVLKKLIERGKREDIDVMVCAGDVTIFGSKLKNIIGKLAKIKKPVLIIPGNHEDDRDIKKICGMFENCVNLHKKGFRKENYLFLGYGGGGFSLIDKGFEKTAKKFKRMIRKNDKVVLVTHAPPYNTKIDKISKKSCGNKSIRKFISGTKPDLVICGHLHECAGKQDKIGKTKIINPGYKGKVIDV
ncbi:metallophosphoesterase [Candidatus Woesearchaeota archaeon]|nr:metallophosphoesterase [Candidatus Woesearchaeota archaeon]